ncbi:MAG: AmmeMemoRadiSam system protein B [Candidatus Krumholzibacteria bacterium]|nr:AmmeMemoRadiSam system protein B [Candidatus Krumholzibacteria bacterium]
MENQVRRPAVAGQFYEGDPARLRSEIESMFERFRAPAPEGSIVAIVSPHAGYVYSGGVASTAFGLLKRGQFETVVVISPCHVDYFPFSSVYGGDAYSTPLGQIGIDGPLSEQIASGGGLVRISDRGHLAGRGSRGEHSLEVQLPFLQVALGDFRLVAIVMGDQSLPAVEALGKALGTALRGRSVLIVASTDLSHFHDGASARRLDSAFIRGLENFDPDGIMASLSEKDSEACGGGPTAAALIAARLLGAASCRVMKYASSGDVTGDMSSVVGYVSAVVLKPAGKGAGKAVAGKTEKSSAPGGDDDGLSDGERIFLLRYARKVLEASFKGGEPEIDIPDSPVLGEKRGGFVTLKKKGMLRGCIGYIEAVLPLVETIAEMAESAAFRDPRFPELGERELAEVTIEISVLSPIREIEDPSEVIVGKHGLIISRDGRRGLLLPQVATEWKWDRETFLSQTCVKAGLDHGAWKRKGTKIEVFTADVFSESDMGLR